LSEIKIKKIEDVSYLEKLTLVDFSYSRIDTYLYCPAKYFYSYITKEPRTFAPYAVLGNIIHSVLENVLENNKQLDIDELQKEYQSNKEIYDPDSLISNDLIGAGKVMIDEFFDLHMEKEFNIYAKELEFNMIIGSYNIRGYIDRVDIVNDDIHIIDYKSGKKEVAAKDVPSNLQLGIYALALSDMFPDKNITASLYYLRSGRLKSHTFSKEDLINVKRSLVEVLNKIINDTNFLPTSNPRACFMCDHSKSGACGVGAYRISK
jgi:ATP-dependent helicase/DNAse subunit B